MRVSRDDVQRRMRKAADTTFSDASPDLADRLASLARASTAAAGTPAAAPRTRRWMALALGALVVAAAVGGALVASVSDDRPAEVVAGDPGAPADPSGGDNPVRLAGPDDVDGPAGVVGARCGEAVTAVVNGIGDTAEVVVGTGEPFTSPQAAGDAATQLIEALGADIGGAVPSVCGGDAPAAGAYAGALGQTVTDRPGPAADLTVALVAAACDPAPPGSPDPDLALSLLGIADSGALVDEVCPFAADHFEGRDLGPGE